nr:uncharacterized protein LOC124815489 [Hydra vulgaris]
MEKSAKKRPQVADLKLQRPKLQPYNALENLYDISTCRCNLNEVPCYDDKVKCKYLTCNNKHLVCVCPPECKIPLKEQEYIKDQRSQNGTKGNIQLGPVDWSSVKKEKRRVGKCSNVKVPSCDNGESSFDINLESDTKHSTNQALIDITETIREALDHKQFAGGVFVDLQKAFDTVDHEILLSKLYHYGVRGIALNWFKSYLNRRPQSVTIEKRRVGNCSNVKVPSCDNGESSFDINLESDTESSSGSEYNESIAISTYNLRKLDNFALECVRYAISSEAAAALGNGLLKDLGVITKTDRTDVLDKSKMDRAKKRVCLQSVAEHNIIVQNLSCIGCDSKDDKGSLVYRSMLPDSISKKNKLIEKVYYLSFTVESGEMKGRYLTHKDILNATGENLAQSTFEVLKQYNSVDSLLGIVFDITNVNTGYKTGLCASLEKKLGRTIHKIGCALHSNELPLRHIMSS